MIIHPEEGCRDFWSNYSMQILYRRKDTVETQHVQFETCCTGSIHVTCIWQDCCVLWLFTVTPTERSMSELAEKKICDTEACLVKFYQRH